MDLLVDTHLRATPSSPRVSYCWRPLSGDQCFGKQSFRGLVEARAKGFANER
jgi:hypothetical protein